MARATVAIPKDFMKRLETAGNEMHSIAKNALEEGADYLTPKLRASMQANIGKGLKYDNRSTGELVNSIGKTPVLENRKGSMNIKVGLVDPRDGTLTNAMLANIIEYGKKEVDQPAKPMLRPIYASEHDKVEHILYEAVQRGVDDI